jgi:hypothetical protein
VIIQVCTFGALKRESIRAPMHPRDGRLVQRISERQEPALAERPFQGGRGGPDRRDDHETGEGDRCRRACRVRAGNQKITSFLASTPLG